MIFSLAGKTAAVTGGGSGIGKSISELFARQGAHVVILDYDEASASKVKDEIVHNGGKASFLGCDVTKQSQVIEVFASIAALDILVNNAGVASIGKVENTTEAEFDRVFNVNVKGVYNCIYAAIPLFRKRGGGTILNMASIAASLGIPDRFAYTMTKGAITAMTMSVAKDYLNENIRCNSVSPARVHTPFVDGFLKKNYPGKEQEMFEKLSRTQPIGRMAKPDEVAFLALYLCSDEAAFITGSDYPIDGGFLKLNT
jgi:2-keto-3-deoxy-L-fuconate dehydrogenase